MSASDRGMELLKLDRGRQAVRLRETESGIQRRIMDALRYAGYIVEDRTVKYKKQNCGRCGHSFWQTGGYGSSKSVADLGVRHPRWPIGLWLAIEVKGPKTPLSAEQRDMAANEHIIVCRTHEDALHAARELDRILKVI